MLGPAAKRESVAHLQAVMGLSERRACSFVGADRKMIRYQSRRPPETQLRGRLRDLAQERRRFGYLPVVHGGGNLFFQLANARYEKGAMIVTSNRGFAEWGEVFGDPVVATALLDRLLHHAVVVQIEGSSYRLRQHAELMPEHLRSKPPSRRRH